MSSICVVKLLPLPPITWSAASSMQRRVSSSAPAGREATKPAAGIPAAFVHAKAREFLGASREKGDEGRRWDIGAGLVLRRFLVRNSGGRPDGRGAVRRGLGPTLRKQV